ncbi:unnamed protein product, partial [Discosporangium mesarthrocarpum]
MVLKAEQVDGSANPSPLRMLVLVGIPGSGKSSVAVILAGRGWVVISPETFGSSKRCEESASKALARGECVAIDRCNLGRSQRRNWVRICTEAGLGPQACSCLFLDIKTDVCCRRVSDRFRHPSLTGRLRAEVDAVRHMSGQLQPPHKSEGFRAYVRVQSNEDLAVALSALLDPAPELPGSEMGRKKTLRPEGGKAPEPLRRGGDEDEEEEE